MTGDSAGFAPDLNRAQEPLEYFPLDAFKMVGETEARGVSYALLEVDKKTFRVKVGDRIGENFGQVTLITARSVTVREMVQNSAGEWIERDTEISMQ